MRLGAQAVQTEASRAKAIQPNAETGGRARRGRMFRWRAGRRIRGGILRVGPVWKPGCRVGRIVDLKGATSAAAVILLGAEGGHPGGAFGAVDVQQDAITIDGLGDGGTSGDG